MRLLLDENLSQRLIQRLTPAFSGCRHVELVGLRGQPDSAIWHYAARHDLTIVSKDNDFRQMSFLKGGPPKVIWLSIGNAGADAVAELLEQNIERIATFLTDAEESLLVIGET